MNRPEFSRDFKILIISFLSLTEMNEVHLFPALMASRPPIFLWNLSTSDEAALVANLGKKSFAGGEASSISAFLPKTLIILPINSPD